MTDRDSRTSGIHVWLVLMKAHRSLARYARRSVEPSGLGLSDFGILELLLHKGAQKVNEIGRRIELTSGSITSAVDRLEARGFVKRGLEASDRRSRIVRLTPEGRRHIVDVFARHQEALEEAAEGLTKAERKALVELLVKLGTTADEKHRATEEREKTDG